MSDVRSARWTFRFPVRSRAHAEALVDEELAFHLERKAEALVASGWSPSDAQAEARRQFGDLEFTRHYCSAEDQRRERGHRRMAAIEEAGQDVRYAFRTLVRSPMFALIVLVTLALGIGANTAIFSVVRAVLLEPLPFPESDRVVRVWHENAAHDIRASSLSEPDLLDWRAESRLAESMGGFFHADGRMGIDMTGDGAPQRLAAAIVTDGFFETLRTAPLLGRTLVPDDQLAGRNTVAVLSHALWERRFNGDRAIVGRTVQLNNEAFTVVGVMPPGFTYPADSPLDVWIPVSYFGPDDIGRARQARFLSVIARLKPGVTPVQLQQELAGIASRLSRMHTENAGWETVAMTPIRESIVGEIERPLQLLLGAVMLVLLITCANVASLLLARASARQRELAVRAALGAGRGRIIRQLLTESLVLALAGGALGTLLAWVALRALVTNGDITLPRDANVTIDGPVLAFTLGVSVLAGVLFGLMPTLRARGASLQAALSGGRGTVGKSGTRMRSGLVVAQVALAVVLITAAGLTTKSFARLLSVDLGFAPSRAMVLQMGIPDKFDTPAERVTYYEQSLDALRALPGVQAVGSIRDLPTRGKGEMRRPDMPGMTGEGPPVQFHHISSDYFKAMAIKLEAGRVFDRGIDIATAPTVTVINQTLAERYFPGQDPVGKALRFGAAEVRVIGVVADVRQQGPGEDVEPAMYAHQHQQGRSGMSIVIRTAGDDPLSLAPAARAAIWAINPDQTIADIASLEQVVGKAVARPRLLASLFALFGLLGLMLGALGIYGVLAFAVSQRRQEIGLRVALGAQPSSVMRLVVGQGFRLAAFGVVLGLFGAASLAGTMQAVLYDIPAADVGTFAQVALALLAVAMVASWIPARRALAIDPAIALRAE